MEFPPTPRLKHWPTCRPNCLNKFYASRCCRMSTFVTCPAAARGCTMFATEGERSGGTSTNSGAIFDFIGGLASVGLHFIKRVCLYVHRLKPQISIRVRVGWFFLFFLQTVSTLAFQHSADVLDSSSLLAPGKPLSALHTSEKCILKICLQPQLKFQKPF